MSGEELKKYLKQRGMPLNKVADELGTSPQNLNGKLKAKSLKQDFINMVKEVIDRCCPPLPAEMEAAVIGSNVNGSNSSNVSQSIVNDDALVRENEVLRQQNTFLQEQLKASQEQVKTLLAIVGQKN